MFRAAAIGSFSAFAQRKGQQVYVPASGGGGGQVPGVMQITDYDALGSGSINIDWEAPYEPNGTILSYNLYIDGMSPITGISASAFTLTVPGVATGSRTIYMAAVNAAGEGNYSPNIYLTVT